MKRLADITDILNPVSNSFSGITGVAMSQPAGISKTSRVELTQVLASTRRFITPPDVADALDVDPGTAVRKLSKWSKDGWLRRIHRGLYIAIPIDVPNPGAWSEDPLLVANEVWSPCYFSGWTAAHHWALTEQVFRTTVLKTSRRVRASRACLLDHDYLVAHTSCEAMDWGLSVEWLGDTRIRFADAARTVVDILDNPQIGGGIRHSAEVLTSYLEQNSGQALVDYGDRLGNRAVFKRLGYLVETLGFGDAELIAACLKRVSSGISTLDPGGPPGGRRVMRWGLRVNSTVVRENPS